MADESASPVEGRILGAGSVQSLPLQEAPRLRTEAQHPPTDSQRDRAQLHQIAEVESGGPSAPTLSSRALAGAVAITEIAGMMKGIPSRVEAGSQEGRNQPSREITSRAAAFDNLPMLDALARHPELDTAYKRMQLAQESGETVQSVRSSLSAQLHQGTLPTESVSLAESRQVMEVVASHRSLMLREGQTDLPLKGEVIAQNSHHVLVQTSDMVATIYERNRLERGVLNGERVTIHEKDGQVIVQDPINRDQHNRDQSLARRMEHELVMTGPGDHKP